MKRLIPDLLTLALCLSVVPSAALAQQDLATSSLGKVKTDIARRLRDEKTLVTIRLLNGSELKGRITLAAENVFTLKENKTGIKDDINYADVAKVKGKGLSKGAKFGILTGILAGAVVIGALVSMKNFDPFENGVLR